MEEHEPFETDTADEQDVRELLAALGRTTSHPDTVRTDSEALPEDVAQRLDDLLGELTAERSRTAAAPVVPLRRNSRRQGWLAAAGIAAAVVLTTVVLPAVLSNDPAPTADTVATPDRSSGGEESTASGPVELSGPLVEETWGYTSTPGARGGQPVPGTPTLRSDTLADDVTDLLTVLPTRPTVAPGSAEALTSGPQNGDPSDDQADSIPLTGRLSATCTWDGPGRAYDVTLDDQRALAVVTGRPDSERVVRLLLCVPGEDPVTIATAHVPAS